MTQQVIYSIEGREYCRELPGPDEFVTPGVRWGEHWRAFTPAYWLSQIWMHNLEDGQHSPYRAQGTLAEEIAFCLLSGHGITAEMARAAFTACQEAGLMEALSIDAFEWTEILGSPLQVGEKTLSYRYPNQKAKFLADAMRHIREDRLDMTAGRSLRDTLLEIKGVGPKTAGFIARNFLDADDVAILDIHIVRAGVLCDLFQPEQKVETQYFSMESRYIEFCHSMNVRPAVLDCLIWDQMRTFGRFALDAIKFKSGKWLPDPPPEPQQLAWNL